MTRCSYSPDDREKRQLKVHDAETQPEHRTSDTVRHSGILPCKRGESNAPHIAGSLIDGMAQACASFSQDPRVTDSWTIRHFSQANPKGDGQGSVPALLRRIADSIEALGPVTVQDVVFHTDITEDGPWHSMTVYFDPADSGR